MKKSFRLIFVNVSIIFVLLVLMESIAATVLYQRQRNDNEPRFALMRVSSSVSRVLWPHGSGEPPPNPDDKFAKLIELRTHAKKVFPNYLFDPQLHVLPQFYHLALPVESVIVNCNENDFWSVYHTDEIGFRNPLGQAKQPIDFIFIGDSYTEGACVQDNDTLAGVFRASGRRVLNLGRSGAGPLFELATLREYGSHANAREVLWFVFLGNDLLNLREEKTTKLSMYIENRFATQRLIERRREASAELELFLDEQVEFTRQRRRLGIPDPYDHPYGETLDSIEAEHKETKLLKKVAESLLDYCRQNSLNLRIVLIEHPKYNQKLQELTRQAVVEFAEESGVAHMTLARNALLKPNVLSLRGSHFSPQGYRWAAANVLRWIERSSDAMPMLRKSQ